MSGLCPIVRAGGLEPPRLAAPDPKSGLATNYNTPAVRKTAGAKIAFFFKLPSVCVGVYLLEKFADGYFQLLVTAVDSVLGLVAYEEIRLELSVLQVVAFLGAVAYDRNTEDDRRILEGFPVHRGHGAGYRHTDY